MFVLLLFLQCTLWGEEVGKRFKETHINLMLMEKIWKHL